jgi:hypothetical protein
MERDEDLFAWNVKPGVLLSSAAPLPPHANAVSVQATESSPLPDISPLKSTVSMPTTHFYEDKELFRTLIMQYIFIPSIRILSI